MRFAMTPEDFLRGALVEPGWHPSVISAAEETMSKGGTKPDGTVKDKVQMLVLDFKITDGPNKGAVVKSWYPENNASSMMDLLEQGFGVKMDKKSLVQHDVSATSMKGKTVDIHVVRGSYTPTGGGVPKQNNNIDGYRPFTGKAPQA